MVVPAAPTPVIVAVDIDFVADVDVTAIDVIAAAITA
jgi:hypothetical protein